MRRALQADIAKALKTPFAAGPIVDGNATTGGDAASARRLSARSSRAHRHGAPGNAAAPRRRARRSHERGAALGANGGDASGHAFSNSPRTFSSATARALMAVIVREAGKTLEDAQGDVREAVDFLRYYAAEARRLFAGPVRLRGPTGEANTLTLRGRGRSPAYRRGIFRSRSSPARSPPRSPPAIPSSPSRPSRRRSRASSRSSCCTRPACRATCCTCYRRRQARRGAGQGPAHPRRRVHRLERDGVVDPARARGSAQAPSFRSLPRPAASTP